MEHRDRAFTLAGIGVLLLLIGIPIALLGPIEMYSFYLFSAGGRFYYEGFGFGSFMFGNIGPGGVPWFALPRSRSRHC